MNTKTTSFNYYRIPLEDRLLATDWSLRIFKKTNRDKGEFWDDVRTFLACKFLKNMDKVIKETMK